MKEHEVRLGEDLAGEKDAAIDEWVEAVERRLGWKLSQMDREFITTYVGDGAATSPNDEDVDGLIRAMESGGCDLIPF